MRKSLLSLLYATSLVFSGCVSFDESAKTDSRRPLEYTEKLFVNPENKVRYYSFQSREHGIQDLIQLAYNAPSEDGFVYSPGSGQWTEIGYKEEFIIEDGKVIIDQTMNNTQIIFRSAIGEKSLSLFHIHRENRGIEKNELSKCASILPSKEDIHHLIYTNYKFKEAGIHIPVDESVVSIYGELNYSLTKSGKKFTYTVVSEADFIKGYGETSLDNALFTDHPLFSNLDELKEFNKTLDKPFEIIICNGMIKYKFTPKKEDSN